MSNNNVDVKKLFSLCKRKNLKDDDITLLVSNPTIVNRNGDNLLHSMIKYNSSKKNIILEMIENGYSINHYNKFGENVFHMSLKNYDNKNIDYKIKLVLWLIELGCSVEHQKLTTITYLLRNLNRKNIGWVNGKYLDFIKKLSNNGLIELKIFESDNDEKECYPNFCPLYFFNKVEELEWITNNMGVVLSQQLSYIYNNGEKVPNGSWNNGCYSVDYLDFDFYPSNYSKKICKEENIDYDINNLNNFGYEAFNWAINKCPDIIRKKAIKWTFNPILLDIFHRNKKYLGNYSNIKRFNYLERIKKNLQYNSPSRYFYKEKLYELMDKKYEIKIKIMLIIELYYGGVTVDEVGLYVLNEYDISLNDFKKMKEIENVPISERCEKLHEVFNGYINGNEFDKIKTYLGELNGN